MSARIPAAMERIKRATANRLLAAMVTLQTAAKLDMNQSTPPASRPGEFLHGVTWNARESLFYFPTSPDEVMKTLRITLKVNRSAWYAVWWWKRNRKSPIDTYKRIKTQIRSIIAGGPTV